MHLLNPKQEHFDSLDLPSREIMRKTVEFFETKGLKKLKSDDHERVWYSDFLEFQRKNDIFATLMTPARYGEARFDSFRNYHFSEILGFYGLGYWYTWQVSMLGLGPIWMSENEAIKKKTAALIKDGGIFAFGLSEKEHGADLMSSGMELTPHEDGTYKASGTKYYIGNANKAALVSVFGKIKNTKDFVFFVVDPSRPEYNLVQNVCNSQSYVAEFTLKDYPIFEGDILSRGRSAWDASLATVAYCKYNLGWGAIGMSTHAFYESITHAANRRLFRHAVTDFPHIKQYFVEAYARLVAMRLFAARTSDYMRVASPEDRRYLLYSPVVKMKVTMQGEEVVNLLWDVIAAKGFEKGPFFEMAARDIRALPKLEGTAHVNMVLILKFIQKFLFAPVDYDAIEKMDGPQNDEFLFNQGSTSKGQKNIRFHDYNLALNSVSIPNVKIFHEQVEIFKKLILEAGPDKDQAKDLDFMLILGELFTLIPYSQLIIENALIHEVKDDLLSQIFDFIIRDFSKYALQLYSKSSSTEIQRAFCLKMIKNPIRDDAGFSQVWENYVFPLNKAYTMNPGVS